MIKNSIINTVATILVIILGLVSQVFLTRYFSVEDYGTYQLMWSWLQIFSFVALNSFNFVVVKAVAQKYPQFFKRANIFCFSSSLIGSAILLIVGFFFRPDLLQYFILLAIFFPFHSGINLSSAYFSGKSKFLQASIVNVSIQFFSSSLQIIILLIYKNVFIALLIALGSSALINIIATIYILLLTKQKSERKKNRELTLFGFQLSGMQLIPAIAGRVQYIILEAFTSTYLLSVYAVAQMFPTHITKLVQSSLAPVWVYLGSISPKEGHKILKKSIPIVFLASTFLTIIIGIFLPIAVKIIFGEKYIHSMYFSVLLLSVLLFLPYNTTVNNYLLYHNYKSVFLYFISGFSVLKIVLYFVTIPIYNINGIIISIIISRTVFTLVQIGWIIKNFEQQKTQTLLINKINENDLSITPKIEGVNILKVIQADYLISGEKYPFWVKIVAKLSFTKYKR